MTDDLAAALATNATAARHFAVFSPSARKTMLPRVLDTKQPETRASRAAESVRLAAMGKRTNFDRE